MMTVSSLVVFAWYVIFTSYFRDQFVGLNKDNSKEEFSSLIDRSPTAHAHGESEEFLNTHALSFDLEEESFVTGKTSDDVADIRKNVSVKGGRKQVNPTTDVVNNNFVQYPDNPGGVKSMRNRVQVSEGSSILKPEQIDLIASWLPGKIIIFLSFICLFCLFDTYLPSKNVSIRVTILIAISVVTLIII